MQFSSNPDAERCGSPQVTVFHFERFALLGLVDAAVILGTRTRAPTFVLFSTKAHFSFCFSQSNPPSRFCNAFPIGNHRLHVQMGNGRAPPPSSGNKNSIAPQWRLDVPASTSTEIVHLFITKVSLRPLKVPWLDVCKALLKGKCKLAAPSMTLSSNPDFSFLWLLSMCNFASSAACWAQAAPMLPDRPVLPASGALVTSPLLHWC